MEEFKICETIRIHRQRKGYSQEAMAFELDISQAAYSKMERGESEITLRRIYEIANILEVSVFDLLPKSKYGSGINFFGLKGALRRLKKFFTFRSTRNHQENNDEEG